ncbi:MAG TPA: glycosyltransferase family 1 protein [Candidatus Woesebacteria bacterium]|nr:glycosyltransferase family 1 protein [Candidatus Woesebacteria bacterium]
MKILIDTSPLESGHNIRGVGFYVQNLKKSLVEYDKGNRYTFSNSIINSNDFDVIHIPYFDPFFVHLPFVKKSKLVVTVHDLTPLVFPDLFPAGTKGNIKWQINKQLLKRADAIITDSDASKKDVYQLTGISNSRIHTVYLAAGSEFKKMEHGKWEREIREKYNLPEKFVLYVGDVTANKNLPRLIEAIKQTNLTLILVGKSLVSKDYDVSNPWNRDLVAIQKEIRGDKQFILLGFVEQEDLVALYNLAQLCVLPSLYEGFGLPVLEAMQSGCPVVTTKNGSLPEVAGDSTYYIDPYDVSSIADGIEKVFYNKELQEKLVEKGLAQAKKFTWKKTTADIVHVYECLST